QLRQVAEALGAVTAGRRPRQRNVVAGRDPGYGGADRLDDSRALVPEHRGAACLGRAVDRVLVRVADAARMQAHEDLPGAGAGQCELRHMERPARPLEDGRADLHAVAASLGSTWMRRSSSIGMWQRIRWPGSA